MRSPAVAGRFYPNDAATLESTIREYLAEAGPNGNAPKALIVPHAGHVYSGAVAASGYARLQAVRQAITRVVLLGPAHYVPVQGLAASTAESFETPLGCIPLDREAIDDVLELPQVIVSDETHTPEHSLEVHLPFLQVILDDFQLVPLVVRQATPEEVGEVLERLWGGPETLIVISSDLSHFHDYGTACDLDRATTAAIEAGRIADLRGEHACGYVPITGLLSVAARHGLGLHNIDLRNSGDTAGSKDRVVGYGTYITEPRDAADTPPASEASCDKLTSRNEQTLLDLCERSIQEGLSYGRRVNVAPAEHSPALREIRTTFVTLKIGGQLRGCMGSLAANESLVENVANNAYMTAFLDPRFSPLTVGEFDRLDISISILSPPERIEFTSQADLLSQIRPGVDGLILVEGGRRGTLLPAVWENIPDATNFLNHVKLKAGFAEDYWSDSLQVLRYTADSISRTR